ncbi:ribonuclease H-like domain-containing protein [Tanacetum coccineum]
MFVGMNVNLMWKSVGSTRFNFAADLVEVAKDADELGQCMIIGLRDGFNLVRYGERAKHPSSAPPVEHIPFSTKGFYVHRNKSLEEQLHDHMEMKIMVEKKRQLMEIDVCNKMMMERRQGLNIYKARLVANGSSQQLGIDCDETFSPVVKPATIHIVLSLALSRHWPIHQLDVKNAFLNGHLSKTVYMHQPPDFVNPRCPNYVCLLQRSLYGLKQAPCAWFQRFAGYATRVGFSHSRCDSSLFIYRHGAEIAYLLIYVDDIVLTASSTALLQRIISSLHREFEMTDLGALNYFLGIFVSRNNTGMFLS